MGREEGGGFRMGNTCIPVVDSFRIWKNQYNIVKFKNKIKFKKKREFKSIAYFKLKLLLNFLCYYVVEVSYVVWKLTPY